MSKADFTVHEYELMTLATANVRRAMKEDFSNEEFLRATDILTAVNKVTFEARYERSRRNIFRRIFNK